MQILLKKLSKIASSLLSLAIISSSIFVELPVREVEAVFPGGKSDYSFHSDSGIGGDLHVLCLGM
jgi:hypothetical protein